MSEAEHDSHTRRCAMLGHEVPFGYCRSPGTPLPCRKLLDCWWERFDVEAWVREYRGEEALAHILAPSPPKTATLLDLINQARSRCGKEGPAGNVDGGNDTKTPAL